MEKSHESYGMINISRFSSNHIDFFGSDLVHSGGINITISKANVDRKYHNEWFHSGKELIRVRMSANQYVDAITSGMNTQGVPCTIEHLNGNRIAQINHIINKKDQFSNEMSETQIEYINKINSIIEKMDGNIGKRKADDIKGDLDTLKRHIMSNTNFVLAQFDKAMEKKVSEAKYSISNYIEHKINTLGIESLRNELSVSIDNKDKNIIE